MPERDLTPFFRPAAVAVIGASADPNHIRGRILTQLVKSQYPGRITPVHPRGGEMLGLPVCTSIAAADAPVDLALIAIPADAVAGVLEECAAAGVRAAYIFSSGFAEEGRDKQALQQRIREISERTQMIIGGPNAVGFMNVSLPLVASFTPAVDFAALPALRAAKAPRRIAVVSQSGGLAFAFFNRGVKRRLPFSYVVNTGNEAALDLVDIGEFLLSDAGTGVVLMFIEQIRRGSAFMALAERALRLGKPLIVAKIGRSAAARRAAISHTASMTGTDAAYEAVFRRYGVIRGEDQDDMLDIAAAAVLAPEPEGRRVGVVTISGGVGGWLADTLEAHGLVVPEFSRGLQARIRTFLPSFGAAGNPIDITGQAIGRDYRLRSVETLENSDEVDAIVVGNSLAADSRLAVEKAALAEIAARSRKPILFYSYPLPSEAAQSDLEEIGIPLYTWRARCRCWRSGARQRRRCCGRCPMLPRRVRSERPRHACSIRQDRRSPKRRRSGCCSSTEFRCRDIAWCRAPPRRSTRRARSAFPLSSRCNRRKFRIRAMQAPWRLGCAARPQSQRRTMPCSPALVARRRLRGSPACWSKRWQSRASSLSSVSARTRPLVRYCCWAAAGSRSRRSVTEQ